MSNAMNAGTWSDDGFTPWDAELEQPDFDELTHLKPGFYSARYLNPPSGPDCVGIVVRDDGWLSWADADGNPNESRFSVEDLCDD